MQKSFNRQKPFELYTDFAEKVCSDIIPKLLAGERNRIIVIGIDGPTAVGKTIFADALADNIRTLHKRKCWTYRLDWNLEAREKRTLDLKNLFEKKTIFSLEAELHMRLTGFGTFLETIRSYNELIAEDPDNAPRSISLDNLYSRGDDGNLTGKQEFLLCPGMIIIIEGHYSLRTEFDVFIDYNILMLGGIKELLSRKVERVRDYRRAADAERYFRLIDLPSFYFHLRRYGYNADLVIDNTDYRRPRIQTLDSIDLWLEQNKTEVSDGRKKTSLNLFDIVENVLSVSLLTGADFRNALLSSLKFALEWDQRAGQYLCISIENISADLTSISDDLIAGLNESFSGKTCKFAVRHTNALYNVYSRTLPITIGLEITGDRTLRIIIDVYHDLLQLQISWAGGYHRFIAERKLGDSAYFSEYLFNDVTPEHTNVCDGSAPIRVITPVPFMIPGFLKDIRIQEVFSGREVENISASQALLDLSDSGGVWIHRFAKFSEIRYFMSFINDMGGLAVNVGNYLISVLSGNEDIRRRFELFQDEWSGKTTDEKLAIEDQNKLDEIIDLERSALCDFVREHCPDFIVLDGYLYCPGIVRNSREWNRVVDQIGVLLNSELRIVRKKTIQFIQKYFPALSLKVEDLWNETPAGSVAHISLDALSAISPTILAEVYLWLALRDDYSAVLGINIYDIRNYSLDCRSYFKAASSRQTAIVFQASLNAIGQKESDNLYEINGYLLPDHGFKDLVEAVCTAARDMVLTSGKVPPLFGIGLDHIDIHGDRPKGRAKRFLQEALASGWVTHYVLDGSALFCAGERSRGELRKAFEAISEFAVDLLDGKSRSYIYDKEVCSCELNYAGGQVNAFIPAPADIELFAKTYQECVRLSGLGANNTRPTLIAGNLGTIHHDRDRDMLLVERSRLWRDRIKRYNFVSAVLHGTTHSHPHTISKATGGCHKINIAGDSLCRLIKALPQHLQDKIRSGNAEPKRMIAAIRKDMNNMSYAEIMNSEESLQAYGRLLLDTVNAPRFSQLDTEYFRYKNYKFTGKQIRAICTEIMKQIESCQLFEAKEPADPSAGYNFFASLIEVPFDKKYERLIHFLYEEGVSCFHVDVGDGKFIPRSFSSISKVRYLKTNFPQSTIHCHLMVENPGLRTGQGNSIIELYAEAGCDAIAVHPRAFSEERYLIYAVEAMRERGVRAGLVVETSEIMDLKVHNLIDSLSFDWVIVMGVPIGYGGQIFNMSTLTRIASLYQYAKSNGKRMLIEADGGLTLDNLLLCKRSGAQAFSGFSIIKDESERIMRMKLHKVLELLRCDRLS